MNYEQFKGVMQLYQVNNEIYLSKDFYIFTLYFLERQLVQVLVKSGREYCPDKCYISFKIDKDKIVQFGEKYENKYELIIGDIWINYSQQFLNFKNPCMSRAKIKDLYYNLQLFKDKKLHLDLF